MNLLGELIRPPFSVIPDWIGVERRSLTGLVGSLVISLALLGFALNRIRKGWLSKLASAAFGLVVVASSVDLIGYYAALFRGEIRTWMPIPGSLLLAIGFAVLALRSYRIDPETSRMARKYFPAFLGGMVALLVCVPALRMVTFGATRYERTADCVVVFGAAVFDNGAPSLALADRVDEGIRLFKQERSSCILMSGAIDRKNGFSEPIVMMQRALDAGVPKEAIVIDEAGVNTSATVQNTAQLASRSGWKSVLVVTHYYHEPRAKMLFERTGLKTYTVPATMTRRLLGEPWYLVREVMAWYRSLLLQ